MENYPFGAIQFSPWLLSTTKDIQPKLIDSQNLYQKYKSVNHNTNITVPPQQNPDVYTGPWGWNNLKPSDYNALYPDSGNTKNPDEPLKNYQNDSTGWEYTALPCDDNSNDYSGVSTKEDFGNILYEGFGMTPILLLIIIVGIYLFLNRNNGQNFF